MAMGWSAAQVAWLKKNDPAKLAKGYAASGANKGIEGGYQGGAASGGGQNPANWTTEQRTAAVKASANPYDDRVAGKPFGPGDSRYGPGGAKAPTDWKKYGADKVNQDLKWQYEQGKTGFTSYEAYLQDHWSRIGKYENRVAKPQEPARRSSGGSALNNSFPEYTGKPVDAPITPEEREEITPPASGLEDTIKTTPQLLRERRKRSYLTRG